MAERAALRSRWFARVTNQNGAYVRLVGVDSSAYPDGTVVDVDAEHEAAGAHAADAVRRGIDGPAIAADQPGWADQPDQRSTSIVMNGPGGGVCRYWG